MTPGRLKAGVAEIEITGAVGSDLASELNPRPSQGLASPLMAKALVLDNDQERLAIITLDLFGLQVEAANRLKRLISQQGNLKPEAIMLICSHTRGGPYTTPVVGRREIDQPYLDELVSQVPQVVELAQNNLQEAAFGVGRVQLPHLCFNHRLLTRNMKAISAWLGVPKNEVLAAEGPTDPEFIVGVLRDRQGHPFCLLWNFAADIRFRAGEDQRISAGLPALVQQELDQRLDRHVPSLYLTGCGGNVSYSYDLERAVDAVTSAVMAAQLETPCDPMLKLGCLAEKIVLPIRDYGQFWSRADIALKYPAALEAFAQEVELLQQEGAHAVPAHIQAFRLGRFALLGLPGLPFVEFGLDIKRRSPFAATLVTGNVDHYVGPVITRQAFAHEGYEAWPARSARLGPGAGEYMAEQGIDLLHELWAGAEK
jgi:hypothetical protein